MRVIQILDRNINPIMASEWLIDPKSIGQEEARKNRSFELFERLTGVAANLSNAENPNHVLKSRQIQMNLLSPLTAAIWRELPIASHEMDPDAPTRAPVVLESLAEIERLFPDCLPAFERMAYNLAFVRLSTEPAGDSQITSASFPCLPFTIFVSDKAFFHIPPNTVSQNPSIYYFVENLIHEVIHQVVNLSLIGGGVFVASFDAKLAPKIQIPWRTSSGARNRAWELDRAWHAYCVYLGLQEVRQTLLAQGDMLNVEERENISRALTDGLVSMNYLEHELSKKQNHLSECGRTLLHNLIKSRGTNGEISA